MDISDRAVLLNGSKRIEVLSLPEIEQYGLDRFVDADYIIIYGMQPRGDLKCEPGRLQTLH